jgi:hypothetical protein
MEHILTIAATSPDEESFTMLLESITQQVREGYTSGFDMNYHWELSEKPEGTNEKEHSA